MIRHITVRTDDDLNDGRCWSAVCRASRRSASWVWRKIRAFFHQTDEDVKLSVEETEPLQMSSVRPFYNDYGTLELRDTEQLRLLSDSDPENFFTI